MDRKKIEERSTNNGILDRGVKKESSRGTLHMCIESRG